jgi:diphosphomevalonate decarboxylase
MHAVMMSSTPSLFYWAPATLEIIMEVQEWRRSGLPVFYTIDAGANVHVITESAYEKEVAFRLSQIPSVHHVISSKCGKGAELPFKISLTIFQVE